MSQIRTFTIFGLLALTGCGGSADVEGLDSADVERLDPVGLERLDDEAGTDAVVDSPGKMLAPIRVDYEILGAPVIGEPLEIELTVSSSMNVPTLSVELRGGSGLVVPVENMRFAERDATPGESRAQRFSVTPMRGGTLSLIAVVRAEIGGRVQSDSVTIPIPVGGVPEPREREPAGVLTTDESGEPIISLPGRQP
jgi:hypothetical protein